MAKIYDSRNNYPTREWHRNSLWALRKVILVFQNGPTPKPSQRLTMEGSLASQHKAAHGLPRMGCRTREESRWLLG